ncbi:MAG: methyltransferase domain-containing protein [Gammaproteobacteria bacterium]|nr:methyltransferase domain-containing protein [Gammaproteobacteria bacterium]
MPPKNRVSCPLNFKVQSHYTVTDLGQRILDTLTRAGRDPSRITAEDLAPIDEFHIRGRAATLDLARAAQLDRAMTVLDVGSGLGGPARTLASEYGCRVTGIDLTDEYCRAARMLSELLGLGELLQFQQGDALDLPFPAASFDAVWTEHVAMNIADKARLYAEMFRVLKPGGTLAIYDILSGPTAPVHFPVPWARTPETSFLASPEELRTHLTDVGFGVTDWVDSTETGKAWFVALAERIRRVGLPPLSFALLMGDDFPAMAENQRRNLEEGRIVVAQVVATKRDG